MVYVIIILIAIGVLSRLGTNPSAYVIPIIVLGTIFLLYKFPPKQWKYRVKNKRKNRFRVIQGKKNKGGDEPPPFH